MVKAGSKAPLFTLADGAGKKVKLTDFKGKKVVLYFYPKDMTPGCTTEACAFRDDYAAYKKKGIVVLGVSADSVQAHEKFAATYSLPFSLLSDPDHKVCEAYGVWQEKTLYGRKFMGIKRMTFIIDEDGKIAHLFDKVKPGTHSQEIIDLLSK